MFLILGLIFLPLTASIFQNFYDKGYIFSKTIGMAFLSYSIFLFGILKLLPFTIITIILLLAVFLFINLFIAIKIRPLATSGLLRSLKLIIFEEFMFLGGLLFWSYIKAHEPTINGLEKFMDFGFVNSILRSTYFPPLDMWYSPFPINYYYFGHLVTAVLTKLSGISPYVTFNLMIATLFAFCFSSSFSIGFNLLKPTLSRFRFKKNMALGFVTAFLVSLAGNLHVIYAFFKPYNVENPKPFWELPFSLVQTNSYWYANATRFIPFTIHEFPLYSWVVSDLHGHVLDIPFVLLTIALLLQVFLSFSQPSTTQAQISKLKSQSHSLKLKVFSFELWFYTLRFALYALLLAFMLAVMYMTNAWDGLIYFLLSILVIAIILRMKKISFYYVLLAITILGVGFFVFSLPFSINFKPFVSGVGVICAPDFLTELKQLGPFLFEKDHCQRSAWWQLAILYGFFYFFVSVFIFTLFKKVKSHNSRQHAKYQSAIEQLNNRTMNSEIFILLLISLSTLLIIIPEFIYVKDIYPAHYRANTMFKLVYQAFIMLSIVSAYVLVTTQGIKKFAAPLFKKIIYVGYFLVSVSLFTLVLLYAQFAINSYYRDVKEYVGLDGLTYLKTSRPDDYDAILWMNENISGQPVILEAQGDSYTDYERISANTGLPTVMGWLVHEWLWRGTYNEVAPRASEVQSLYEGTDMGIVQDLIQKYRIQYVYIGGLEREKYPRLYEKKFAEIGDVVYQRGTVTMYKIRNDSS